METVTFNFGTKKITLTAGEAKRWDGGESTRYYYELSYDGKHSPVNKLYLVSSGDTRDEKIVVGDRVFGYEAFADSKTKREAIKRALTELCAKL